jgi:hypothetical protein
MEEGIEMVVTKGRWPVIHKIQGNRYKMETGWVSPTSEDKEDNQTQKRRLERID